MKVIVTGSRTWDDKEAIREALLDTGATVVVHGGAPGADWLANDLAHEMGLEPIPVPAQWAEQGKSAGPRRNSRMLAEHPDATFVIGFPQRGSVGTLDCLRKAKALGFKLFRGRGSWWPKEL